VITEEEEEEEEEERLFKADATRKKERGHVSRSPCVPFMSICLGVSAISRNDPLRLAK
jgi:hypothetical protein